MYTKVRLAQFLFLLLVAVSCSISQTDSHEKVERGEKVTILQLLPEGEHKVDMMDHVTMPARTQELMMKFQKAARENPDFFLEVKETTEASGKPYPYDKRVGMTEPEYYEFLELMSEKNGLVMTKSGTETVTITYSGDKISFQNNDRLELLNRVTIDLSDSSVTFGEHRLTDLQEIDVTNDNNGLKSSWSGYVWRFDNSNKDPETIRKVEDFIGYTSTTVKLIVARLDKSQKTYMHIQYSWIEDGKPIIDYQMPLIFQ